MPVLQDLQNTLQREIRIANDANCFALSEATDGAAKNAAVVFGVIIGTGTGAGVVIDKKLFSRVTKDKKGKATKLLLDQIDEKLASVKNGPECASDYSDIFSDKSIKIVTDNNFTKITDLKTNEIYKGEYYKQPCRNMMHIARCHFIAQYIRHPGEQFR